MPNEITNGPIADPKTAEVENLRDQVRQLAEERDIFRQELAELREKVENYRRVLLTWAEEHMPAEELKRQFEEDWERYQRGEKFYSMEEVLASLEQLESE
jgi:hypothetical protein